MKKQAKFHVSILRVAFATELLLLIPLIAMQFTDEVAWGVFDFVIAGALLFGAGLVYAIITRSERSILYRIAIGFAVCSALFMIWANLAVGLIGSGPNAGNLMFMGALVVGITWSILAHFQPIGMQRAMYATAGALAVVAIIALLANMQQYPGSSAIEIIGVSGFFIALFVVSGLLFGFAAKNTATN